CRLMMSLSTERSSPVCSGFRWTQTTRRPLSRSPPPRAGLRAGLPLRESGNVLHFTLRQTKVQNDVTSGEVMTAFSRTYTTGETAEMFATDKRRLGHLLRGGWIGRDQADSRGTWRRLSAVE